MAKRLKVALLTISCLNIGAVLQAFALKEYLCTRYSNLSVELLRLKPNVDYNAAVFKAGTGRLVRDVVVAVITLCKYFRIKRGIELTEEFKNINFTFIPRDSTSDFMNDIPPYDIYLTGSDQVFNIGNKNTDIYYQRFAKNGAKKLAYAPSFGVGEFDTDYIDKIKTDILDFDALSCREESGAAVLSQITERNIPRVLDPTLLLSAQEWDRVAVQPNYRRKYIFIYDLNGGQALVDMACKIKADTGLDIVCFTLKPQKFYRGIDKQIYGVGPAEFLGWISRAEYVVTDSFHGTIFSINYDKPFTAYIAFKHTSQRIVSLLTHIGLSDRLVYDPHQFNFSAGLLRLEYDKNKLIALRKVSQDYLDSIFRDEQ